LAAFKGITLTEEGGGIMPYGIKITHEDKDVFASAVALTMKEHWTVEAYKVIGNSLHLKWHYDPDVEDQVECLFPMTAENVTDFVWGWLKAVDYGRQPDDNDGSLEKGFEVCSGIYCEKNNESGADNDYFYLTMIVTPKWLYFGK
jgi:hypothetical protein